MSKPNHSAEEKLRALGQQLRQAWAKQHPVTDKERRAVDAALEKQWQQTHPADATKGQADSPSPSPSPGPSQTPEQTPSQPSQRQDHDHEQSQ
jgi:hypothetical protein